MVITDLGKALLIHLPVVYVVWPQGIARSRGASCFAWSQHSCPQKSNWSFFGWMQYRRHNLRTSDQLEWTSAINLKVDVATHIVLCRFTDKLGSSKVVVFTLWLRKYVWPLSVTHLSHRTGKGKTAHEGELGTQELWWTHKWDDSMW